MGGTNDPSINSPANLIVLCGSGTTGCHGHVEVNRREARDYGWAVSQYADPHDVPVQYKDGLFLLDDAHHLDIPVGTYDQWSASPTAGGQ